MVPLSPVFDPIILKGIRVFPENPLQFNFIVDSGENKLEEDEIRAESERLIKYFLTALTIPEEDLWVNLSPYEKDRIVPNEFGITEMGRDLLAQDYLLKQIASSLMYPENELGERFWERIYSETSEKYGEVDVPVDTFNKVWIVPEKAVVYTHGDRAFVVESKLKVMLEEDYIAHQHNQTDSSVLIADNNNNLSSNSSQPLANTSTIIREVLIPELEKEVNHGENFVALRQIYNSLILATWFKRNLKKSLLGKVYVGKNKVEGVDVEDIQIKQKIYEQYVESFKTGVYNYIREEYDPTAKEMVPKKYFSGGMDLAMMASHGGVTNLGQVAYDEVSDPAMITDDIERDLMIIPTMLFGEGKNNENVLGPQGFTFERTYAAGKNTPLSRMRFEEIKNEDGSSTKKMTGNVGEYQIKKFREAISAINPDERSVETLIALRPLVNFISYAVKINHQKRSKFSSINKKISEKTFPKHRVRRATILEIKSLFESLSDKDLEGVLSEILEGVQSFLMTRESEIEGWENIAIDLVVNGEKSIALKKASFVRKGVISKGFIYEFDLLSFVDKSYDKRVLLWNNFIDGLKLDRSVQSLILKKEEELSAFFADNYEIIKEVFMVLRFMSSDVDYYYWCWR